MSSSGAGGTYWPRRQSINESEINGYLRARLRGYNDRDAQAIKRHINNLRDVLEQEEDDVIPTLFGGSVSRHTYVNGLSDADVLMIINDSTLSGQSPKAVIQHMADLIRRRMPKTDVSTGNLAVTVKYADGNEVQILPAIRTKGGIRIAEPRSNQWSKVLHPERFAQKLTKVNQANRGQVIPTIKLMKVPADRLVQSDRDRITGYHIESLAIEAFKNHQGPYDLKSMLTHLADFSSTAVQQPIRDSTGQSRHVDEYLGPQGSEQRRRAAATFRSIKRSIDNCKSTDDLDSLFDS